MAISSPLDIAWTHAYWVEGPEFLALYGGGGPTPPTGGWMVGAVPIGSPAGIPDGTRIGTWPDEVGTLDATQATAGSRPHYHSSSASFNNKPYVDFPAQDVGPATNAVGVRTGSITAVNSPHEIVVIARSTAAAAAGEYVLARNGASQTFTVQTGSTTTWNIYDGSTNATTAAIFDTAAHVFDAKFNYPTDEVLFIDGVQRSSVAPLPLQHALTRYSIGPDGSGGLHYPQIVFVGVKLGALLSAGDRSDLVAWSQSHYSTP